MFIIARRHFVYTAIRNKMVRFVSGIQKANRTKDKLATDSLSDKHSKQYPELPDFKSYTPCGDLDQTINVHSREPTGNMTRLEQLAETTKGSLIPQTLKQMEDYPEIQLTAEKMERVGQHRMAKEEKMKRQMILDDLGLLDFFVFWQTKAFKQTGHAPNKLTRKATEQFQIHTGLFCNQACNHCHVESSPKRKEMMNHDTAVRCMEILVGSPSVKILDLTGQEDTAQFLAEQGLHVIASMPCYTATNVNQQRGRGVYDRSIQALLNLNSQGFGKDEDLQLDLVFNPLGECLPPPRTSLTETYREELWQKFGIEFNNLYTINNMPITRFADYLYRRHKLESYMYMDLLVRQFNLQNMETLMCRSFINVNWNGDIFDCDFNQQLDLQTKSKSKRKLTVWDINSLEEMADVTIRTDNHCFGCTAGNGTIVARVLLFNVSFGIH